MKFMVIGHGRHGKDTVCELLRDKYDFTFESSSMVAAKEVLYPKLKEEYGYETFEECYADRHGEGMREVWFNEISAINTPDKTTLGRMIYKDHDIYCGIRCKEEFEALRDAGVFNFSIWVDGSARHEPEDENSCTVRKEDAQYVLDNNGSLEDLKDNLTELMLQIKADVYGVDLERLRKAKKGKRNYDMRKAFNLLTLPERIADAKKERKAEKAERGAAKIWGLLHRVGI